MRMKKTFTVSIERLAHDGAGEGVYEGKPVRVMGMFPFEEGIVEGYTKKGLWIGTLREIIRASPSRKNPEELHAMTCGPWQTITYPLQLELKRGILEELYAYYPDAPKPSFHGTEHFYGYRTKIEFSFTDRDVLGDPFPLTLAFHARGGGSRRVALPKGCLLASEEMNRAAILILQKLRTLGLAARDLKTLILRESKANKKLLALLFAKSPRVPPFDITDIPNLSGLIVFYSTEQSPASVPTKELWRIGDGFLDEIILGMRIRYPWDAFFQNNVPMFESAMHAIANATEKNASVLELYAGVGTMGLWLAKEKDARVHGIEVIPAAVDFAKMNARQNHLEHYTAECISAEHMDARIIEGRDMLLLDPPRSGLHPGVIAMIREKPPPTIAYLSCNPETQSRDYSAIRDLYTIITIVGYDFYPQTPHLESLLLLKRRS